jgi:hypothetical protein
MYYMNKCLLPIQIPHPNEWGTCDAVMCCGMLWSAVQLTHILLMLRPYLDSAGQPEALSGQCWTPEVLSGQCWTVLDRQRGHLSRTVQTKTSLWKLWGCVMLWWSVQFWTDDPYFADA